MISVTPFNATTDVRTSLSYVANKTLKGDKNDKSVSEANLASKNIMAKERFLSSKNVTFLSNILSLAAKQENIRVNNNVPTVMF